MSLRKNIRPGLITLHTNDNLPISDSSSLFVHFLRDIQNGSVDSSSLYLSSGILMVRFDELISIPRYVML